MLSLNFSPFPVLQGQRILLKQISPDDAPALFDMRSHKETVRYLDRPPAQNVEEVQTLIGTITRALTNNEGITWGLFLKDEIGLVGTIGFWRVKKEDYRAEIGYMLHPAIQGKGLMGEAVKLVLQYGFAAMKLHSVEGNVNPLNAASIRLLERNGFIPEAYFRENFYYNGRFIDSAIYSLLKPGQSS